MSNSSRAVASVLGCGIGDALGMVNESFPKSNDIDIVHQTILKQRKLNRYNPIIEYESGGPWKENGHIMKAGEWTDDTSMMLCLADSILIVKDIDVADLMIRFHSWWFRGYNSCTGHSCGLGGNIKKSIYSFDINKPHQILGGTNPDTDAGNGSLMRLAPVPVYWSNDLPKALEMARLQTSTTHNVLETLDGSALMTFIIWQGINGMSKTNIFAITDLCPGLTHPGIKELAQSDAAWRFKSEEEIRTLPGRCLWSLEAALWCVYFSNSFKDAVIKAVNLNGDSDTIGAITGQIAGAIYGSKDIPHSWISQLKHKDQIINRAEALYKKNPYNKKTMEITYGMVQ